MINRQFPDSIKSLLESAFRLLANGTHATLFCKHSVIIIKVDSIILLKVSISYSIRMQLPVRSLIPRPIFFLTLGLTLLHNLLSPEKITRPKWSVHVNRLYRVIFTRSFSYVTYENPKISPLRCDSDITSP